MKGARLLFAAALAGSALTVTAASAQDGVTSLLRPQAPATATGAAAVARTARATPCAREASVPRAEAGGVASQALESGGSGAGEYARFLPQAAGGPAPSKTDNGTSTSNALTTRIPLIPTGTPATGTQTANPNRPQRPAPGTAIPAWADRPLYVETTRPLWSAGESGKRNGADNRGRHADPIPPGAIPPGARLGAGVDRRLWNPGESARPGGDDTSGRQADARPTDPTRTISLDPPLWNDGASVARSPARSSSPCEGSGEAASGSDAGRF